MKISHLYWPVTFFSTAFGAGIFFLPQAVGPGVLGMNVFMLFIVIAMSVSMMAHYLFFKFIISHPEKDFLAASSTFIGERAAAIVCVLFILSMIIIVLINFITLVNVVASFFHNGFWVRGGISLLLSAALSAAWLAFSQRIEHLISRMALVSIVLVAILAVFSCYNQRGGSRRCRRRLAFHCRRGCCCRFFFLHLTLPRASSALRKAPYDRRRAVFCLARY